MKSLSTVLSLIVFAVSVSPVQAQRNLKDIPVPDPELERRTFEVAEGFEVNLFAADPQIAKPIQMNFDAQGRLWVATSEIYPHIKPGQKANDKILILEDTNHDGVSDKTSVFADGLMIPTGVLPGDGGAYVANATELLHLTDTDNDGKADKTRIMLSGFGTEDTHHILHTFRWGPDGAMYFNQSIYIHSHLETPHGVKRLNGGGIWKYRPHTDELDIYARGWVNPWGHQFDKYGQSFVTDGAGGQGINYLLPGAAYQTAVGVPKILPGLNPGSPKYCGLEIVGGSHLPPEWEGNLITNDFRGHRVCRFEVSDDGAGFSSKQLPDLIRSTHVAFRPIDVQMGPDGAIYIADWYNPIIQHGEVDFRDDRRDHTHGRIWRVTAKGRKTVPYVDISKVPETELFKLLDSPEPWQQRQSRNRLQQTERARQVNGESQQSVDKRFLNWRVPGGNTHPRSEQTMVELLRLATNSDSELHGRFAGELDRHVGDAGALTAIARLAGELQQRDSAWTDRLKDWAVHPHPRVRLEAIRSLAKAADGKDGVLFSLGALTRPQDRWIEHALWLTCRETADDWLPALIAGEFDFEGNSEAMAFAIRATSSTQAVAALSKLLSKETGAVKNRFAILRVLAELGGPAELQQVLRVSLSDETETGVRATLLDLLADAARTRKQKPAGDLTGILPFIERAHPAEQHAAMECAGAWKLAAAREPLRQMVLQNPRLPALKGTAVAALVQIGGDDLNPFLRGLCDTRQSVMVQQLGVQALAGRQPEFAAKQAVRLLQELPADQPLPDLYGAFLDQKRGTVVLADALKDQKIPADAARFALRAIESSGRELPELANALRTAGSIQTGPVELTAEEMQQLLSRVRDDGDIHRGEAVYRRADLNCITCHAIGGAGGAVGPDLVSLGGSAQPDYIVESLLQPNKKVKENYHTLVVATDAGEVASGVLIRQTDRDLLLRDAAGKTLTIPLDSVVQQKVGKSLMPAGLTEKLTSQELVDLVRFLSELGKPGGIRLPEGERAKQWQTLAATDSARYQLRRTGHETVTKDLPEWNWQPVSVNTQGVLPVAELPRLGQLRGPRQGEPAVVFARTEFEVTSPGKQALKVPGYRGLRVWLNQEPLPAQAEHTLDLPRGKYRLTFAVTLLGGKGQPEQPTLSAEFPEDPQATGTMRFLGIAE